jgi:hypothetical protein
VGALVSCVGFQRHPSFSIGRNWTHWGQGSAVPLWFWILKLVCSACIVCHDLL